MDLQQLLSEVSALPASERWIVLDTVWDSLHAEPLLDVSPEVRRELDRRLDELEATPNDYLTPDEVLQQLREKS